MSRLEIMTMLDLTQSFINLISERQNTAPKLGLGEVLAKINTVLNSYAEKLDINVANLTLLHLCLSSEQLHPLLEKHLNQLSISDSYRGQHRSRLKQLIRGILCPEADDSKGISNPIPLNVHLPEPLQKVWVFLPRPRHIRLVGHDAQNWSEAYLRYRCTLPLSKIGLLIGLAMLQVWKLSPTDSVEELLEGHHNEIIQTIKHISPSAYWRSNIGVFKQYRERIKTVLGYEIALPQRIGLKVDELPEPLRTQVQVYIERARFGFKSDLNIKVLARKHFKLKLGTHSEDTIYNYTRVLGLGAGHILQAMPARTLDVRELLKLVVRDVEIDGIVTQELYSLQVDCYRMHEMTRQSDYKEEGFDSGTFAIFINAIAAIAAYNGFLGLRKQFLKEYELNTDGDIKIHRKKIKKHIFDRPWMDKQIQRLGTAFHQIATEGSFKNEPGGGLRRVNRYNLNLCLFYVALVTMRYLGVRQQSIRNCVLGKNVVFGAAKSVTFQWTEKETKNAKGVLHRLNMTQHDVIQKILIDAACTYNKKIYPYLSGSQKSTDESLVLVAKRQKAVAGQFFLKSGIDGLCLQFTNAVDFYVWFTQKGLVYLDYEDRLDEYQMLVNPHFLRAMFGDWLKHDLGYPIEQVALMAGDTKETFEADYITDPSIYDVTDDWTDKSNEIRAKRKKEHENDAKSDASLKRVELKVEDISQKLSEITDGLERLSKNDRNEDEEES